jgi:hypothetical protein
MKEGILHIKLTKKPSSSNFKREKKPDGGRLGHWTESVIIIKTIALSESPGNKTRFVALNRPIRMLLDLENLFRINDVDTRWWRNKIPSLIVK